MKFVAHTVLSNDTDPETDLAKTPSQRFDEIVEHAVHLEALGFDGFGVGERHLAPDIATSPAVVLAVIAARTTRLRLLTTVAVLPLLDPVRVAEDFATLDNLSHGRLDLVIGKGTRKGQADLFGIDLDLKWDLNRAKYELLRRLWRESDVTWEGKFRPPLHRVTTQPRPYQHPPRIWHGSASSRASAELAAEYGDPLFSANAMKPTEVYSDLVDYYRERIAFHGHPPERAWVAVGVSGLVVASRSQDAVALYRPVFERMMVRWRRDGFDFPFDGFEDFVERSSLLVGSPAAVQDKIVRLREQFGNEILNVGSAGEGLGEADRERSLELFASEVIPGLQERLPSRAWLPNDEGTA